jgi:hypothetical protein
VACAKKGSKRTSLAPLDFRNTSTVRIGLIKFNWKKIKKRRNNKRQKETERKERKFEKIVRKIVRKVVENFLLQSN